MITIGYVRVSSSKQTLEHQRFKLENFAINNGIKKANEKTQTG
ncbi:MAG: recombinase family protein [Alphaproteobacteria bacterium]|nr:recombinase family protein [Alphaproteobacteria bacterium]